MSPDILLFALIAAGLIFWLRSILGTKDDESGSSRGAFSEEERNRLEKIIKNVQDGGSVIPLGNDIQARFNIPRYATIENKTTENRLEDILKIDKTLDLGHFVEGARGAFSIIVEAFAAADRETLEGLLSKTVYQSFDTALLVREKKGERISTDIHAVRKVDITEAKTENDMLYLTVRFTADETCVVYNSLGEIMSGDPDKITEMRDVWVFGRKINSPDPIWLLYETREGNEELGQSPLPDASK